jgi:hypothetical protein
MASSRSLSRREVNLSVAAVAAVMAAVAVMGWLTGPVATAAVAQPAVPAAATVGVAVRAAPPVASTGQGTLTRVAGADRIATAIAASKTGFPAQQSAGAVVIARADDFADALAGGPLAVRFQGPLLLTPSSGLTPDLRTEIQRVLAPGHTVYLLGGTGAIAATVDSQLQSLGFNPVRVSGVDRYDTAVKIAAILGDPPTVFEADGTNFPDGLSAGPAAALSHGIVLLTAGHIQAPATAAYLALHLTDTRYAVGGPAAAADPAAQPLVGADRYATSIVVARNLFAAPGVVTLASGAVFADALSGGPLAAFEGAPMILVPSSGSLPSPVQAYLNKGSSSVLSALLFGGTAAVSTPLAKAIAQALVLVPSAN